MDPLTPEQRKKNMKSIKSKDTKVELILRKALWKKGYRYRKNYSKVKGKPDICFPKIKLAIFCDSDFWHGKKLLEGKEPETNKEYWIPKLKKNIERDKEVNKYLKEHGWTVLRFWEKDIKKNVEACINKIESEINN
jgi:DNA mismatch endonuclease (patch repair protein)